jgi:hypothetical protein
MKAAPFRKSPCCGVRSRVRGVYLAEHQIVLLCSKCRQLRIEPLRKDDTPSPRWPHLKLVVNNPNTGRS